MIKKYAQVFYEKTPLYKWNLGKNIHFHQRIPFNDMWPGDSKIGKEWISGYVKSKSNTIYPVSFLFENKYSKDLSFFHQFTWLRHLNALGDDNSRITARELILKWCKQNSDFRSPPWNKKDMSHRLFSLIVFYDFYGSSAPSEFKQILHPIMEKQAHHFIKLINHDVINFEYLFHLKALLFIRFYFDNTGLCEKEILSKYENAIKKQILKDGFHINRKSSSQILILRDLIDIRSLLAKHGYRISIFLKKIIEKVTPTVRFLRHSDGCLSSLGEEKEHIQRSMVDSVLSFSDINGSVPIKFPIAKIHRMQVKNSTIILNHGPSINSSDKNFWGSLNFEWCSAGIRIIKSCNWIFFHNNQPIMQSTRKTQSDVNQVLKKSHAMLTCKQKDEVKEIELNRFLYLSPSAMDLRCEDTLLFKNKSVTAWNLIKIHSDFLIDTHSSKNIILVDKNKIPKWRLVHSKNVEVLKSDDSHNELVLQTTVNKGSKELIKWGWSAL